MLFSVWDSVTEACVAFRGGGSQAPAHSYEAVVSSWLGRLCSQVPKGAAGAGRGVSGECGPHCSVQLLWRPRPSRSSLEAWQVEQPAAFFLPGPWRPSDFKAGSQ